MTRRTAPFLLVGLGVALLVGVLLSGFASPAPDGLESAVLQSACRGDAACLDDRAGQPVYDDAPLPGYANTPLSGLVGTLAAFALGAGVVGLVRAGRAGRGPESGIGGGTRAG